MASLRRSHNILVVLSGDKFIAFSNGQSEEMLVPNAPTEEKEQDKSAETTADVKNGTKNCVLASCFSASGKYFAVGDNQKQLHVYKVSPEWELVSSRSVVRRCTAITFPSNEKEVVVADRTGDVYKFSLIDTESKGELILGHLSMILDLAITKDDKYIITCDRDEKIRISHYPNAYNIHSFCLLHTEYVSQILYISKYDFIISGSGDGRLASWSLDGKNLSCTDIIKGQGSQNEGGLEVKGQIGDSSEVLSIKKMVYDSDLNAIAVIFHRSSQVSLYQLNQQENKFRMVQCSKNSLDGEPWDICFDSNHRLWILLPCEQAPVVVYDCCRNDSGTICMFETINDESVQKMKTPLCNNWSFFKASVECQNQFISLQKNRDFENVQRYLEKKEERINAQKNKTTTNQPPAKKIKKS